MVAEVYELLQKGRLYGACVFDIDTYTMLIVLFTRLHCKKDSIALVGGLTLQSENETQLQQ